MVLFKICYTSTANWCKITKSAAWTSPVQRHQELFYLITLIQKREIPGKHVLWLENIVKTCIINKTFYHNYFIENFDDANLYVLLCTGGLLCRFECYLPCCFASTN